MNPTFSFSSELVLWQAGQGTWVYATVPLDESDVIKEIVPARRGFGSVRVKVHLNDFEWRTSIFPMKEGTFFLPVKTEARKKGGVDIGDTVDIHIDLLIED